jgi:hypothetical protein
MGRKTHLVEDDVAELVEHVWVPVPELEQCYHGLERGAHRVFLDALLHHLWGGGGVRERVVPQQQDRIEQQRN